MWIEKRLEDMIRQAQHNNKRPDKPVEKWSETVCLHCNKKVKYRPREGFTGKLKCPHCGKEFMVPRLDDW